MPSIRNTALMAPYWLLTVGQDRASWLVVFFLCQLQAWRRLATSSRGPGKAQLRPGEPEPPSHHHPVIGDREDTCTRESISGHFTYVADANGSAQECRTWAMTTPLLIDRFLLAGKANQELLAVGPPANTACALALGHSSAGCQTSVSWFWQTRRALWRVEAGRQRMHSREHGILHNLHVRPESHVSIAGRKPSHACSQQTAEAIFFALPYNAKSGEGDEHVPLPPVSFWGLIGRVFLDTPSNLLSQLVRCMRWYNNQRT